MCPSRLGTPNMNHSLPRHSPSLPQNETLLPPLETSDATNSQNSFSGASSVATSNNTWHQRQTYATESHQIHSTTTTEQQHRFNNSFSTSSVRHSPQPSQLQHQQNALHSPSPATTISSYNRRHFHHSPSLHQQQLNNTQFLLKTPTSLSNKTPPYLLSQIQTFIAQNLPNEGSILKKHASARDNPTELKLQLQLERLAVYREAFRVFIEHFKVYGPVLNTIRTEYDKKINSLLQDIQHLKQHQQKLSSSHDNVQIKIHQMRQEHQLAVKQIKDENAHLTHKLQLSKDQEHSLERKIQEIQFAIRDMENSKQDEKERSYSLKDALQFSRESVLQMKDKLDKAQQEAHSHARVKQMYSDSLAQLGQMDKMVRKEDHQKIVDKNREHREMSDKLTNQLKAMKRANKRMQEQIVQLKMEIQASENRNADNEKYLNEAKRELLRTHTPRPDWEEIGSVIPELNYEQETSVNIAKDLERYIADIQETMEEQEETLRKQRKILSFLEPDDSDDDEHDHHDGQSPYFVGKGNSPDVPKYLRYTGKIKNKNLAKREVENLIQEVWKMRLKQSGNYPFEDCFETFLVTRYGNVPGVKAEWAYAIIEGCKRFRYDPDCDLFLSVLEGNVSEDAYREQFAMIDKLRALLVKLDEKDHGKITGQVKKKHINAALDKFFPGKSSDDLIKVKCMLHRQNPDAMVDYEKLFEEDRNHSQGEFVECIREQFLNEVQGYARDIDRALRDRDLNGKRTGSITFLQVKDAFYEIDPLLPKSSVESAILKALEHMRLERADRKTKNKVDEQKEESVKWKEQVDLELFIRNLKKVLMLRRTKVEQIEEIKEKHHRKKKRRKQKSKGG